MASEHPSAAGASNEAHSLYLDCMNEVFDGGPILHVIAADDLGMTPSNSQRRPFRAAALALAASMAYSVPTASFAGEEIDTDQVARMMLTVSQMEKTYLEDFQSVLPGIQVNLDYRPGISATAVTMSHMLVQTEMTSAVTPLAVDAGDRSCTVISTAIDKTMSEVVRAAGQPIDLAAVGRATRDTLAENIYGCLKQAVALLNHETSMDLPEYIEDASEYADLGIGDIEAAIGGAYLTRTVFPDDSYQRLGSSNPDPFTEIANGMSNALSERMLDYTYAGGLGPEAWGEIVRASQNIAITLAYPLKYGVEMQGLDLDRISKAIAADPWATRGSEDIALLIESMRNDFRLPHRLAEEALDQLSQPIESMPAAELYGESISIDLNADQGDPRNSRQLVANSRDFDPEP